MDSWQSRIDREIQQAINDGDMTDNPGVGKPLELSDDPHTPDELKMAFKVLRENDALPDWIAESRELDKLRDGILQRIAEVVRVYRGALGDVNRAADDSHHIRSRYAENAWKRAQGEIREEVAAFNRRTNALNLKLPSGVNHRPVLNAEREIERALQA